MKAANEVLGASVPVGANHLFKSTQQEHVLGCVAGRCNNTRTFMKVHVRQ